jgi:hypothetical protein
MEINNNLNSNLNSNLNPNLKKIEFTADKVDIGKKRIDGNRTIIFDVGEYEHIKLRDFLGLPDNCIFKVTVEIEINTDFL